MSTPKELSDYIIAEVNKLQVNSNAVDSTYEALIEQINTARATYRQDVRANIDRLINLAGEVGQITVPTDPGTPSETVWGYTAYRTNLSNAKGDGLKDPSIYRMFDGDKNLSFSKSQYEQAPVSWVSWKADQFRPQDWGTQVISHAKSVIPKDRKVLITAHHEPENNAGSGQSLQQWAKAYREGITEITKACRQLRLEGWDIWSAPIVCDWVFQNWGDKADINLWYPTDGSIEMDIMGWDSYPQGQTKSGKGHIARLRMESEYKPAPYVDPKRFDCYMSFRRTADHAAKLGVPWAIGEIGMVRGDYDSADVQYKYSLEQRAQWFLNVIDDINNQLGDKAPAYVCWYFDGGCRVTDSACVNAVNTSL